MGIDLVFAEIAEGGVGGPKALGFTIAKELLLRADEAIQKPPASTGLGPVEQ